MNQTIETTWIALAERIYRALLILYPGDYRRAYGALMIQIFRDVSRDKYRRQGAPGVMLWWCKTLLDLALTATEQWKKVEFTMNKSAFARMTSILLVSGGSFIALAAFSQLQPGIHYTYEGIYQVLAWLLVPGFFLMGLGCIALGLRYEQVFSPIEQWALYLSGVGAIAMAVGVVTTLLGTALWNIWLVGNLLHTIALLVFGVLHLLKPTLPIFRALPLQMAGGWLVLSLGLLQTNSEMANNALAFLMYFGMGLAWLGIGIAIQRQQRETVPVAA